MQKLKIDSRLWYLLEAELTALKLSNWTNLNLPKIT